MIVCNFVKLTTSLLKCVNRHTVLCILQNSQLHITQKLLVNDKNNNKINNHKNNEINNPKHFVDYESYRNISSQKTSSSKLAIMQVLHLSSNTLDLVFSLYPELKRISPKDILWNYQVMRNYGVQKSTIRDNVYLLAHSGETLGEKIAIINKFGLDINYGILFAPLTIRRLQIFLSFTAREKITPANKIYEVGKLLEATDVQQMCRYFLQNRNLRSQPLSKIKEKINFLLNEGFTKSAILSDGTVLGYTKAKMVNNMNLIKKYNIKDKKLWMIRCSERELERHSHHFLRTKTLDGKELSLEEYLAKRLNTDTDIVKYYLMVKNPYMTRLTVAKVKIVMDIIEEYKIAPEKALFSNRIFSRSAKTLKSRLKLIKETFGEIPNRLTFLYMSNADFNKFMKENSIKTKDMM